jgi:hypothetical protein
MADDLLWGYHPAAPHADGEGLRIKFEHCLGLTERTLLQRPFYFQCPPLDAFTRALQYSHSDYETLDGQQHSHPAAMQLRSFTFNTVAVDWGAPWTLLDRLPVNTTADLSTFTADIPTPLEVAFQLEKLLESGTAFYMSARSPLLWHASEFPQGRLRVTMRSLEVEERAGEIDARYFNINLVEFRRPIISERGKGRAASSRLPVTLLIRNLPRKRDTLYELAKFYYGSASKWRVISKANGWRFAPTVNVKTRFRQQRSKKVRIPALRQ